MLCGVFSSWDRGGSPPAAALWLLTAVASPVEGHMLTVHALQQLRLTGLAAPQHVGVFPDQGSNPCPLHWQADCLSLDHQGSPISGSWVTVIFNGSKRCSKNCSSIETIISWQRLIRSTLLEFQKLITSLHQPEDWRKGQVIFGKRAVWHYHSLAYHLPEWWRWLCGCQAILLAPLACARDLTQTLFFSYSDSKCSSAWYCPDSLVRRPIFASIHSHALEKFSGRV